ncbi:hypothetical protein Anas_12765 [Armadillidium nasatum]|uniref:ATP-binding cassette sub-family G member 1 n=1 Tax=Armadillidium nasatum TaxID=96803 RepID=A0A5N5T9Z5_9CRUS|nr:hypothetical protein Anas_12765 [Armadillidium nasatum]
MQDEHLLEFLTIQESMEAAATLKLGNSTSSESKKNIIREILSTLGLEEGKNTRVSNLSGGEKKRLSIAFELINNPPVMFFDEPTSGLDSQNSYQCIVLLRKLAEEGRTIICSIHQPSAKLFEKFDYVYALAEGHCVYRGTVPGLLPFISSISLQCPSYHNPADFLIEVSSGEYGNFISTMVGAVNRTLSLEGEKRDLNKTPIELDLVSGSKEQEFKSSKEENTNFGNVIYSSKDETTVDLASCNKGFLSQKEEENLYQYSVPLWIQFYVLLGRTFKSIFRDPMMTLIRLAAHIVVGIFIGLLYYNFGNEASQVLSNVGYLFFCILFYVFTAMMPTIVTFPLETKVLVREHLNNWYSLKAYYLAKTLADVPFQIAFTVIYITIAYFMTNQPYEAERFLLIVIFGIFNSLISQSIGLAVGAALNVQHAVFVAPVLVIPQILFSGFFILISAIPVYLRWLTYLTYVSYCYQGSFKITYGLDRNNLHCSEAFCFFKNPKKILQEFDINNSGLWFDCVILLIYFFIIRILGYFILRWKVRKERE